MAVAERWFRRAERYRELAEEMAGRGFYAEACFFAQQAAEFALKGLILALSGARPYTHSIYALLRIAGIGAGEDLTRCAKLLTEQYIAARYPDARVEEYDELDAEECLRCMRVILRAVEKGLRGAGQGG